MTQRGRYLRATDLDSWREDRRIVDRGFVHAWDSRVADGNGEDAFVEMLENFVGPDDVVLDLGCGHGELALRMAEKACQVIGVDRDATYLALATELAEERGESNVRFVEFAFNDGESDGARLAIPDGSVTLVVNRRGPTAEKWLAEVRRIARPGATVLVMHPAGGPPAPAWAGELPRSLAYPYQPIPFEQVKAWVDEPLRREGIDDYRIWWYDVPEWFSSPEELRQRLFSDTLAPGEAAEATDALRRIIEECGGSHGVALRHQRLICRFTLP